MGLHEEGGVAGTNEIKIKKVEDKNYDRYGVCTLIKSINDGVYCPVS